MGRKHYQVSFISINLLVLFCLAFLHLIESPSNIFAQPSFSPIDCTTMNSPVLAFETSKGQNPNDVFDFLTDLQGMGVDVGTFDMELNSDFPTCLDMLIIHGLANNLGLSNSYSTAEANRIKNWIESGHSLMVSGDWGTKKYPTQNIFQSFGYTQLGGVVEDGTDHDPAGPALSPYAWVIYQTDNFLPHPILSNTNRLELQASGWFDSASNTIVKTDLDAEPGDVSVMAAFEQGSGCAVLTADSNWYATDGGSGGYFKQDNTQIAQQAVDWLLHCEGTVIDTPPLTFQLFLPLVMRNYCQAGGMDIILSIDSSKSMLESTKPNGPTKLSAAQKAAVEFLSLLDFSLDQAGVVSFDRTAVLDHPLSTDQTSLENTINGLDTDYETRIDLALSISEQELTGSRHIPHNYQVLILISDGQFWGTTETAVYDAATHAKAAGITLYTIGLGQNVNQTILKGIASTNTNHYYYAPSTSDLTAIFTEIAASLPCYGE